jgi:hypothetical protein
MRLHDGTGTHVGMLWGVWLLDPASRWLVEALADAGVVDPDFTVRPAPHDDPETLKVIVLMTDGNITQQFRPGFADRTRAPVNATAPTGIFLNHSRELERQTNGTHCGGQPCRIELSNVSTNRSRFFATCDRAKANGIVVFTISFNANATARQEMQRCASSMAHFYDVRGADLDDAFQSIAGAIQTLRLVQ